MFRIDLQLDSMRRSGVKEEEMRRGAHVGPGTAARTQLEAEIAQRRKEGTMDADEASAEVDALGLGAACESS